MLHYNMYIKPLFSWINPTSKCNLSIWKLENSNQFTKKMTKVINHKKTILYAEVCMIKFISFLRYAFWLFWNLLKLLEFPILKWLHCIYYLLGLSLLLLYGSCIYLCNQCLSPLKLWVCIPLMTRCTIIPTFVVKFVSDLQQVGCFLQVVFNQSDFLHQ